jgi:hypothetical protein
MASGVCVTFKSVEVDLKFFGVDQNSVVHEQCNALLMNRLRRR